MQNKDISYSLGKTFEILNKHRLNSGIDNFGCGMAPWMTNPTFIFIFISIASLPGLKGSMKLEQQQGSINELIKEPYRWDQKVFLVIIDLNTQKEKKKNIIKNIPEDLKHLCFNTGGDIIILQSLKETVETFKSTVIRKLFPPGLAASTAKLHIHNLNNSEQSYRNLTCEIKPTKATCGFHWLIPEYYSSDASVFSGLCEDIDSDISGKAYRTTHPNFHIAKSSSLAAIYDKYLQVAAKINFPVDTYALTLLERDQQGLTLGTHHRSSSSLEALGGGSNTSLLDMMGLDTPTSTLGVYDNENFIGNDSHCFGVIQRVDSRPSTMTGIYLTSPNTVQLVLLPYNFTRLVELLIQASKVNPNPNPNPNPNQY